MADIPFPLEETFPGSHHVQLYLCKAIPQAMRHAENTAGISFRLVNVM